jgi:hypothetical protein
MKGLSDVQNMRMQLREESREEIKEKSQGQKEIIPAPNLILVMMSACFVN